MYRKKLQNRKQDETENNDEPSIDLDTEKRLPIVIVTDEENRIKEENEKATMIQRMYRDKKQKASKQKVDEVLGIPIDKDMENTALFIQLQYRKKKAKQSAQKPMKPNLPKVEEEEVEEGFISSDPNILKEQEEKAAYIQRVFRKKQNKVK